MKNLISILFAPVLLVGILTVAGCSTDGAFGGLLPPKAKELVDKGQVLINKGQAIALNGMVDAAKIECARTLDSRKATYDKFDAAFKAAGLPQQAPLNCDDVPGPDFTPPPRE